MEQAHNEKVGRAALLTPSGLHASEIRGVSEALTMLLADVFALYLKTNNFRWHVSGPSYREYRQMLGQQGDQLFEMTDPLAERTRKIGGTTLRSISHIGRLQRILDNDSQYVSPLAMLSELRDDNAQLAVTMRATHSLCDEIGDVATAGLLETWIDRAEGRVWFLFEAGLGKAGDEQE